MSNYDGGAYERKWGKMVTLTGKVLEAHLKWDIENEPDPDDLADDFDTFMRDYNGGFDE
jgi:hypothetical protein|tara:strand:+ start:381 stop:557 length:177 start_codon:yes stop_codon:yes gene_type:complete